MVGWHPATATGRDGEPPVGVHSDRRTLVVVRLVIDWWQIISAVVRLKHGANPIYLQLLPELMNIACSLALAKAGSKIATRIAKMAITNNNSIEVNARAAAGARKGCGFAVARRVAFLADGLVVRCGIANN